MTGYRLRARAGADEGADEGAGAGGRESESIQYDINGAAHQSYRNHGLMDPNFKTINYLQLQLISGVASPRPRLIAEARFESVYF